MNNSEKRIPLDAKIKYIAMCAFLIIFEYQAYYYIVKGFDTKEIVSIIYNTKSTTDYKVYLKENEFFETEYLEKDNIYISSLIDNINTLFTYDLQFSDIADGEYKYYVLGTIIAGNNDNKNKDINYWTKEYMLSETETVDYKGLKSINITKGVILDYQKYNEILKDFKQEYGLSINGLFKVELIVESTNDFKTIKDSVKIKSIVELDVPLTQQTIELKINTANNDVTKTIQKEVNVGSTQNNIFFMIGIVCTILNLVLIIIMVKKVLLMFKNKSEYDKRIKKILTTYSGIIVEAISMPSIKNIKIVSLNTFEDLIDAHSEVRLPINYIADETGYKADFILISGNIGWIYTLKDAEYDKIMKRREAVKKRKKKKRKELEKETKEEEKK